jgi:hypothetical protein
VSRRAELVGCRGIVAAVSVLGALALLSAIVVGSCASDADNQAAVGTGTATTPDGSISAKVAAWPIHGGPDLWWLLVELTDTEIDGSTSIILEVRDEIGCHDVEGVRVDPLLQLEPGTAVTFERGQAETHRPVGGEETSGWPATLPVSAVRVQTACPAGASKAAATLTAQRAAWEAARIDSYDFTLSYTTMFLFGTYRISVVDGAPVSAQRIEASGLKDYLLVPELPKTIDAVFDQLEGQLAGDRFDIEFDDLLGYPTHVRIDLAEDAVDDETEFAITDFDIRTAEPSPDVTPTPSTTED